MIEPHDDLITDFRASIINLYSQLRIVPSDVDFLCPSYLRSCKKQQYNLFTGNWAYVGERYGEAYIKGKSVKILFVGMDMGGAHRNWDWKSFTETQAAFRESCRKRYNPHMGGVSIIVERLIDQKEADEYSMMFALTNALKCTLKTNTMNATRDSNMILNCSNYLLLEIELLKPDIIITQGRHPKDSIIRLLNLESPLQCFGPINIYRNDKCVLTTPHPARLKGMKWKRGELPDYFENAIKSLRDMQ